MATYEVNQLNITKDGNTYRFSGGGSGNGILYGTSNTAADVQAKTVTIDGISEYTEGLSVRIKFVNGQTYDGAPTLNINSLGAKNIQTVSGTLGMRYMWRAGEVVDFTYDGTAFIEVNGGISTTDYYGVTKLSNAVNSESTYVAATPYAVKQAYDKATTEFTGADASNDGEAGIVPAPMAGDQGKFLKGDRTWGNVPNPQAMTGATSSADGSSGLVPAPLAGQHKLYLKGDGTWGEPDGVRLYVADLDTVTNTSGSYTHTSIVTGMTSDLKAVLIECGNPEIFKDKVTITTGANSVTLTCTDVAGTSTVKVSFAVQGNANPLSSTEYAALDTRIGDLSDLTTSDKSSVVGAVNALNSNLTGDASWKTLSGGIEYRKVAGIVFVSIYKTGSFSPSYVTLGTLPSGYRPDRTLYFAAVPNTASSGVAYINANGTIAFSTNGGTATACFFQMSFPV